MAITPVVGHRDGKQPERTDPWVGNPVDLCIPHNLRFLLILVLSFQLVLLHFVMLDDLVKIPSCSFLADAA